MTDTEKKWTEIAKMRKGRTIVGVRYMSEEEAEDQDWYSRPIVMFLDNGEYIFPILPIDLRGAISIPIPF